MKAKFINESTIQTIDDWLEELFNILKKKYKTNTEEKEDDIFDHIELCGDKLDKMFKSHCSVADAVKYVSKEIDKWKKESDDIWNITDKNIW